MIIEFTRILKFALQSIFRNIWLSLVTISIIILALFSTTFLLVFNLITQHTLEVVEKKTDIYIEVTKEATTEQAKILAGELSKLDAVSAVDYITPEQTLKQFKERHKDNQLILQALESVSENPFRGSLKLNVKKIEDFPSILNELSRKEYADYLSVEDQEFNDAKILIEGISNYSQKIQQIALILSLIFIIIAILVVFNTIQVGIYTHREEIGIMRLVGASNSFIRSPFLIEGLIYTFISMAILIIIIYPLFSFIQPYFNGFFKDYTFNITSMVNQNFIKIFGIQMLISAIITGLSSFIAVRRYLKV